ncbi:MAG: hypothetical protein ACRD1T_08245, partial [Acidimicrobiia bacterium]
LTEGFPFPLPHPTMWLLIGPVMLGSVGLLSWSVGVLARDLDILRPWRFQLGSALLCTPMVQYGHPEDLWAATALVVSIRLLLRDRQLSSALVLGASVGFKQWTLLALPVLVSAVPKGMRMRAALFALAVPAIFAGFLLAVDWENAGPALLAARNFPSRGHPAPWTNADATSVAAAPFRMATFAIAIASGSLTARKLTKTPPRLMDRGTVIFAGLTLGFLSRALLEPVLHPYYVSPILLFLALRLSKRVWPTVLAGLAVLVGFAWHPNPALWWILATSSILFISFTGWNSLIRAQSNGAESALIHFPDH